MREEQFDIMDEHMRIVGQANRSEVHARGYWHQTFHCWIYTREAGKVWVLFQKRHPAKDTNPNLYDITCAGHLLAGETVEDGVRELEEELGLAVRMKDLEPIGVIRNSMRMGNVIDNEFYHVFRYECPLPLDAYRLQEDEVTGLVRMELNDALRLFANEIASVEASGIERTDEGDMAHVSRTLELTDLVPHGSDYYLTVMRHIAACAVG